MTHQANAMIFIIFELLGLAVIILVLFFVYYIVIDIIKCINDTKQKFIKDINEYECNAISWQK